MPLIVQKFGGTSVADSQKILAAARKAIRAQQQGNQVVMVVSAMGKNTDMLVDLAGQINDHPPAREIDMLLSTGEQVSVALMAMAIDSLGHKAVSLTGGQIGIKTDSSHTKARINSISTERIQRLLDEGNIVIAAGFQGIDEDLDITTLGRGGSDLTAVALAAVLGADTCEIYTDVDGVYTTDPRALPEARRVSKASYDEMLELASLGAGVLHSRSVEFAKKYGVPIHVRSSFSDTTGSFVVADPEVPDQPVGGAALTRNEARVTVKGIPDRPGTSYAVFSKIAEQNVAVDMIVQNIGEDGKADISFTVLSDDLPSTTGAVGSAIDELGAGQFEVGETVAKVSVVGMGMARQTGVADRMFRALADADVNILMITTSEIKISALVERDQALDALRAVHSAFELEKAPESTQSTGDTAMRVENSDALDVVTRLAGMEDLMIDEVALDDSQARITISQIPDEPGVAAKTFENIAEADIFVDMIIQSFGHGGRANLSFTVPRDELDRAAEVATSLAEQFGCGEVTSSPQVAKLSVSGVGLRSHVGVAIRMFKALADAAINVEMINTSEVRVNVVVDGAHGQRGLECLQTAFADVLLC
ncbi:MAG: aspartate kinase [Planctomycetota bacterium]|nr:aspartate kinase [Planctomycetota bacterium]